jgi:hypothetical protein
LPFTTASAFTAGAFTVANGDAAGEGARVFAATATFFAAIAAAAAFLALARFARAALAAFSARCAASSLLALDDFFLTLSAGRETRTEAAAFDLRAAVAGLDFLEVGFDAFLVAFFRAAMGRYLQTRDHHT